MNIQKLEAIYETDQKAIKDFKNGKIDLDALKKIHSENKAFLLDSITTFGFPFKNVSSEKAYKGAFLTVQHSGDIDLMNKFIELFLKADNFQIERRDLAYLIDRVRILQNLPQMYGTQYKITSNKQIEFFPIEDEDYIEQRRKEFDMETFEEYKKQASYTIS